MNAELFASAYGLNELSPTCLHRDHRQPFERHVRSGQRRIVHDPAFGAGGLCHPRRVVRALGSGVRHLGNDGVRLRRPRVRRLASGGGQGRARLASGFPDRVAPPVAQARPQARPALVNGLKSSGCQRPIRARHADAWARIARVALRRGAQGGLDRHEMGATVPLASIIAGRPQHRMHQARHFDSAGRIAQHFQQDRDPRGVDPPRRVEFDKAAKDETLDIDVRPPCAVRAPIGRDIADRTLIEVLAPVQPIGLLVARHVDDERLRRPDLRFRRKGHDTLDRVVDRFRTTDFEIVRQALKNDVRHRNVDVDQRRRQALRRPSPADSPLIVWVRLDARVALPESNSSPCAPGRPNPTCEA